MDKEKDKLNQVNMIENRIEELKEMMYNVEMKLDILKVYLKQLKKED